MRMIKGSALGHRPNDGYPEAIKKLRADLGLTQQALADKLGVSFATVNRWENGQTRPSQLSWSHLRQLEITAREEVSTESKKGKDPVPATLDFTAPPETVKVLAEGERLSFGHLANPTFATEISRIDPLPHQRIAVYEHMLSQPRLHFLLADDAGAGVHTTIHEQKMGVKLGDTFWGMCTLINPLDWSQNSTAILQAASRADLSN
jgi:transcriptional regulator with XRE-family HTH domain